MGVCVGGWVGGRVGSRTSAKYLPTYLTHVKSATITYHTYTLWFIFVVVVSCFRKECAGGEGGRGGDNIFRDVCGEREEDFQDTSLIHIYIHTFIHSYIHIILQYIVWEFYQIL